LGAHPDLRHREGGSRAAGPERISGHRNRILKGQLKGRLRLSDAERATLGEIGHRLGRKVLAEVATVARYRKLIARKFSGSQARQGPGRPRLKRDVEQLIIRMASENRGLGLRSDRGRHSQ
jgi:putative transposase